MSGPRYDAFSGYGIELEYMIVDQISLEVMPIADLLLHRTCEEQGLPPSGDVNREKFEWSNELVLHVLELKTTGPAGNLADAARGFHREIADVNRRLAHHSACLASSAMHPWMNPAMQMKLWPHDSREIYDSYNRIFSCQGHGWSNLQSMHINLPFRDSGHANDQQTDPDKNHSQFGRLHAAVRLVLPIIPALSSSSPYVDGKRGPAACSRLEYYRRNQERLPSITGMIIPEQIFSKTDYENEILERIYDDIRPHDPDGLLQYEWLNSRGAIARFDRNAIEIRLCDIQERPAADLAIADLLVSLVKDLYEEKHISFEHQKSWATNDLSALLDDSIKYAENGRIDVRKYAKIFGVSAVDDMKNLVKILVGRHLEKTSEIFHEPLRTIIEHGTLATRMIDAHEKESRSLHNLMSQLRSCLADNHPFIPSSHHCGTSSGSI